MENRLSITVDRDEGATAHTSIPLLPAADSQLFFGGQSKNIIDLINVWYLMYFTDWKRLKNISFMFYTEVFQCERW